MSEDKRIIEINGIKLEVDMRYCRQIDKFSIGDNVKVLVKGYSDDSKSYPGVIVGFDNFPTMPAIIIAYLDLGYSEASINIKSITSKTIDIQICPANELVANFDKDRVVELMDRSILKKEEEISDLKRKKDFFTHNFKKYFSMPVENE